MIRLIAYLCLFMAFGPFIKATFEVQAGASER